MSLINQTFESLPVLDRPVSPNSLARIQASLSNDPKSSASAETGLHPFVPELDESKFSDLIRAEHARLTSEPSSKIAGGFNNSKYESLAPPDDANDTEAWKQVLQAAGASHTYLNSRSKTLALLETHGKNAWLLSNYQLEGVLGQLEKELESAKAQELEVNQQREQAQEDVRGQMKVLEDTWKEGVGRALEAEVAAEELRRKILEERRRLAQS